MRVASAESARRLGSQLAIDATVLRSAVNLLERGGDEATICARTLSALGTSFDQPTDFAIVSRTGRFVCGSHQVAGADAVPDLRGDMGARLSAEGMTVTLPSDTRVAIALI